MPNQNGGGFMTMTAQSTTTDDRKLDGSETLPTTSSVAVATEQQNHETQQPQQQPHHHHHHHHQQKQQHHHHKQQHQQVIPPNTTTSTTTTINNNNPMDNKKSSSSRRKSRRSVSDIPPMMLLQENQLPNQERLYGSNMNSSGSTLLQPPPPTQQQQQQQQYQQQPPQSGYQQQQPIQQQPTSSRSDRRSRRSNSDIPLSILTEEIPFTGGSFHDSFPSSTTATAPTPNLPLSYYGPYIMPPYLHQQQHHHPMNAGGIVYGHHPQQQQQAMNQQPAVNPAQMVRNMNNAVAAAAAVPRPHPNQQQQMNSNNSHPFTFPYQHHPHSLPFPAGPGSVGNATDPSSVMMWNHLYGQQQQQQQYQHHGLPPPPVTVTNGSQQLDGKDVSLSQTLGSPRDNNNNKRRRRNRLHRKSLSSSAASSRAGRGGAPGYGSFWNPKEGEEEDDDDDDDKDDHHNNNNASHIMDPNMVPLLSKHQVPVVVPPNSALNASLSSLGGKEDRFSTSFGGGGGGGSLGMPHQFQQQQKHSKLKTASFSPRNELRKMFTDLSPQQQGRKQFNSASSGMMTMPPPTTKTANSGGGGGGAVPVTISTSLRSTGGWTDGTIPNEPFMFHSGSNRTWSHAPNRPMMGGTNMTLSSTFFTPPVGVIMGMPPPPILTTTPNTGGGCGGGVVSMIHPPSSSATTSATTNERTALMIKGSKPTKESTRKRQIRQQTAQQYMDQIKGVEQPLKCRNVTFLLFFVFHLLYVGIYIGKTYWNEAIMYHNPRIEPDTVTIYYHHLLFIATCSGIFAIFVSTLLLCAMTIFARHFLQIALMMIITLSFIWGTIGVGLSPTTIVPVTGVIALGLAVGYAFIVWDRIPFSAANLISALSGVKAFPGTVIVAISMQLIMLGWCVYFSVVASGVYNALQDGMLDVSYNGEIGCYLFLGISFYWTYQVIHGYVKAVTASVISGWWHTPEKTHLVKDACFNTLFYSLGSICFGGLVIGPATILRQLSVCTRPSQSESSSLLCFHECFHFLQSVAFQLVYMITTRCNAYSFTYVGMYHYGFLKAGAHATDLFNKRGWTTIVSDDLVHNILVMASLVMGGITGCFAYFISEIYDISITSLDEPGISAFLVGTVIGLMLNSIVFAVVISALNTVLVCFASSPVDFEKNHPELSTEMRTAWREVWPGALDVNELVVQQQQYHHI